MSLFGKKGPEIIDYTLLEKKGLIKTRKTPQRKVEVTRDGFVKLQEGDIDEILGIRKRPVMNRSQDIAPLKNQSIPVNSSQELSENPINQINNQNPLSFLDNLTAASGQSSNLGQSDHTQSSQLTNEHMDEVKNIKVKLEDLEYKLERLVDKFEKISMKLLEFEQKVSSI